MSRAPGSLFATRAECDSERGSALVVAMLVSVILALLGMSFLMMGETESRIAVNEKRAAQALYVAEAGAQAVKRWFDYPSTALMFPPAAVIDYDERTIIDETDPYNPAAETDADGSAARPWYKWDTDLDGIADEEYFERPFRGGLQHSLLGTRDEPDMRIDDSAEPARAFLEGLSQELLGAFPQEPGRIEARISRIDIFAPPYIQVAGTWQRYGMGSASIVARVYQVDGADRITLAEREVQVVLSEAPYRGPYGPLHSCGDLSFTTPGPTTVHWGPITAAGTSKLLDIARLPVSIPRTLPGLPRFDSFWTNDAAVFGAYKNPGIDAMAIPDPWFRGMSGGRSDVVGAGTDQASPVTAPGVQPAPPFDNSNIMDDQPMVVCPDYAYASWKTIATGGGSDVRYFAWSANTSFRENGVGPLRTFRDITNGAEGVYFFDTKDSFAPVDENGDGVYENLTPPISISGGAWSFRGFLYLNAESFQVDGAVGAAVVFNAPGEPYQDLDADGVFDAGEGWINLSYPVAAGAMDDPVVVDKDDAFGGAFPMRNERGPGINGTSSFHGILFTNGYFEATGTARLYGSIVAKQGVTQALEDGSLPTPEIYWDSAIQGDWPPDGWALPRVAITRWSTER